ncbi:MAG TPA: PDZ domain-containing protein [Candidatus Acidoferrales bacterium]|nr:PDZ domain-containing protein [Candidatus Acidoferrales bacterium]
MIRMISPNSPSWHGCGVLLAAIAIISSAAVASAPRFQAAATPTPSGAQVQFANGGNVAQVPVEMSGNLVFVAAGVNDAQPSWFLIDTARATSAFDDIRAASQNLLPSSTGNTRVTSLSNATLDFPGLKVTVASLSLISLDDISSRVGRAVQGILGADVLSQFVLVLDYERATFQLYDPKSYHYTGKGEKMKWTLIGGVPAVSARVEVRGKGKMDGEFLISTGEPEPIVFSSSFAAAHGFGSVGGKMIPFASVSDPERVEGKLGRVQSLTLGKTAVQDALAVYPTESSGASSSAEVAGTLGAGILNRFTMVLDYSGGQLILEPNPRLLDLYTADMSGLGIIAIPPDYRAYEVAQVVAGSPAAEAGFAVGDILDTIDGNPASDSSLDDVRALLRQEDSTHKITVQRNGKSLEFTIKLKPIV